MTDKDIKIHTVDIELVGSCNYRCKMCPHTDPGRESDFLKSLPWSVFTDIIDEAIQYGLKTVRLHGSGEPTLYRRLPDAVDYCKRQGLAVLVTTNGSRLDDRLSQDLVRTGLDQLTVSATGYDRDTYERWMGTDLFDQVRDQVRYYVSISDRVCNLYHLIIDPGNMQNEIQAYHTNWIDYTGARYEIWQMHNWSGNYQTVKFDRRTDQQRSCGRMFQPVLEVRAGGLNGHYGAVVACCMALGSDSAAVLGHLDDNSIADIWLGTKYQELRHLHATGQWNQLSYCQGCDQLYDRPESLVATNLHDRAYNKIKSVSSHA